MISFSNSNTLDIPFSQEPNTFTLITLNTEGIDFSLKLISETSLDKIGYQSAQIFLANLFLSSEDCIQCTVRISANLPVNISESRKFAISFQKFDESNKKRTAAEYSIQETFSTVNGDKIDDLQSNKYMNAVNFLSQSPTPQDKLRACYLKALNLYDIDDLKTQSENIENCIVLSNNENLSEIANSLKLLEAQYIYWQKDRVTEALNQIDAVIGTYDQTALSPSDFKQSYILGRANLLKGMIHSKLGDYLTSDQNLSESRYYFEAIGSQYNIAEIYSELGTSLRFQNKFEDATGNFIKAFQSSIKSVQPDAKLQQARIRYSMAVVSFLAGQYYYALKLIESLKDSSLPAIGLWEAHIEALKARLLLELGNLEEAKSVYENAWNLYEKSNAKSHLATIANNLARLHTEQGNIEEARSYLSLAIKYAGTAWGEDQSIRIKQAEINYYILAGKSNLALQEIKQLEKLLEGSSDTYRKGRVISQKGEVYIFINDYTSAINELNKAIQLHKNSNDYLFLAKSYYFLALASYEKGANIESILKPIQLAKETIESIRNNLLDDRVRQEFFALQKQIYELNIELLFQNVDSYSPLSSLYEAESFKARTLYESMSKPKGNRSIEFFPDDNASTSILEETFQVIRAAPSSTPSFPRITREELVNFQTNLQDDEAILYYFTGEKCSYFWLIDKNTISTFRIPSEKSLTPIIDLLALNLKQNPATSNSNDLWSTLLDSSQKVSFSLFQSITSELDRKKRLVVIPDGSIHKIPFSVLLDPSSKYKQPLIDNFAISYASSIATLNWLNNKDDSISNLNLLLVSNPGQRQTDSNYMAHPSYRNLYSADIEAEKLSTLWQSVGSNFTLQGSEATESNLKKLNLSEFQVIHFATHAYVNWDNPELSAIKLYDDTQDLGTESTDLTFSEISNLNLDAQLVVLSACETAAGRLTTGEGPIGISRAFLQAGAKRVLASLWPVEDEATSNLISNFYYGLIELGLNPDDALKHAKLEMMKSAEFSHPFYWSSFILIGDKNSWPNLLNATIDNQRMALSSSPTH